MKAPFKIYPLSAIIVGLLNHVHLGAILLAALLIVAAIGYACFGSRGVAVACAFSAAILLLVQLVSRLRHIFLIRALRFRGGQLEVYTPAEKRWVSADRIERFAKKFYCYADPWGPSTTGYPGLLIALTGIDAPAEHLYPYGLTALRDNLFEHLARLYPDRAQHEKAEAA